MAADDKGRKDATPQTCAHNHSFLDALPFGDRQDFEDLKIKGKPKTRAELKAEATKPLAAE